jgi:hypothetical protein
MAVRDPLLVSIISQLDTSTASGSSTLPAPSSNSRSEKSGLGESMDVRGWRIDFRELRFQAQIGAGSFGRVGAAQLGKGLALLLSCVRLSERFHQMLLLWLHVRTVAGLARTKASCCVRLRDMWPLEQCSCHV